MNMGSGQEQMVWLVDFQGYALSKLSLKVTKDTARILQSCYPERLALAILYNPPKVFETFYAVCNLTFFGIFRAVLLQLCYAVVK